MKKVAVIQSNYIPWKGYFDIIHDVDLFIFNDDLQYTKNDWRNRNKVKTPKGVEWLTIPVGTQENRLICEVELNDARWARRHWNTLERLYSKAKHFERYRDFFRHTLLEIEWRMLSDLNQFLIKEISRNFLGIKTEFGRSRDFAPCGKRVERLLCLLGKAGADLYVSGPTAKAYIDDAAFDNAGIKLVYKDYSGYPEHDQLYPPFVHGVSIVDLLFHTGPDAAWYIWGWREGKKLPPGK